MVLGRDAVILAPRILLTPFFFFGGGRSRLPALASSLSPPRSPRFAAQRLSMHGTAIAAAVAPAALVAAVAVGYILGKRGGRQRPRSAPTTQCACGASLHGFSDNARERHYASARHRRNIRLIARCAKIVVAENWGEYRNAIAHCVRETDTVLEVGCGNGVTTSLLSQTAARAVGVDLSAPLIDEARRRFPLLEWHSMDARRAGDLAKLARFDAIFVDLNGSRELETLCPLIDAYEAAQHSHSRGTETERHRALSTSTPQL